MAHAFANRNHLPAALAGRPSDDHWSPRETLLFTATASALLWMLILRLPGLLHGA